MPTMATEQGGPTVMRMERGVSVRFEGMSTAIDQQVVVEVVAERIVHVRSTPLHSTVARSKSLVVPDSVLISAVPWEMGEDAACIQLKTARLITQVSKV